MKAPLREGVDVSGLELRVTALVMLCEAQNAHLAALRAVIPSLGGRLTGDRLAAVDAAEREVDRVRTWMSVNGYAPEPAPALHDLQGEPTQPPTA